MSGGNDNFQAPTGARAIQVEEHVALASAALELKIIDHLSPRDSVPHPTTMNDNAVVRYDDRCRQHGRHHPQNTADDVARRKQWVDAKIE